MALPAIIPEDHIKELDLRERTKTNPPSVDAVRAKRNRQRLFLDIYRQVVNIKAAEERAGLTPGVVTTWKKKDPEFCRMFNAALGDIKAELASYAIVRARGYRKANPDGTPAFDPDGTPIYENNNDTVLMKILDMDDQKHKHEHTFTIEMVGRDRQEKVIEGSPEI